MSSAAKSLGQFVADVLSVVGAATYVPAAVIVGGLGLAGLLATSDESNPVEAIASASSPTFAELALFILVVAVVAAILEPLQLRITRLFEGYWGDERGSSRVRKYRDLRQQVSDERNKLIATKARLTRIIGSPTVQRWDRTSSDLRRELADVRRDLALVSAEFDEWPRAPRVLPTRLGNSIRAFEDRASGVLVSSANSRAVPGGGQIQDLLPFAYFAIPQETRDSHDRFRSQVQSLTTLVVVMPVIGMAVSVAMLHLSWGWLWGICSLSLSAIVALAAHFGARDAGEGYGVMLLAIAHQYSSGAFSADGAGIERTVAETA